MNKRLLSLLALVALMVGGVCFACAKLEALRAEVHAGARP